MRILNVNKVAIIGITLLLVNFLGFPLTVYANGNEQYVEEGALEEYSQYEKEKDTGKIDDSTERMLNEQGVFDNEIELMDEITIEHLNEAEIISVETEYSKINDEGNVVQMSNQEISDLFEYKYQNELKQYRIENKSFFTTAMESIGIIPKTVNASNKTNYSTSKCFKKSIIITQKTKGSGYAHATIYFTWLTDPEIRHDDFIVVYFADALIVNNSSATCKYYYTETSKYRYSAFEQWKYHYIDKKIEEDYTSDMKENWLTHVDDGALAYAFIDLADDISGTNDGVPELEKNNHYIVMQMDIKRDEHDIDKKFTAQVKYYHQEHFLDIQPNISISSDKNINFSGALGVGKSMHAMGETLVLIHTWK